MYFSAKVGHAARVKRECGGWPGELAMIQIKCTHGGAIEWTTSPVSFTSLFGGKILDRS